MTIDDREEVRCIFAGRLDPNKGQDIAIQAVKTLQSEGLGIGLVIAGDVWFYLRPADHSNSYRRKILAMLADVDDGIFLGHVPHQKIAEVYREHHVAFVLSRSNEPFGLVALEAMASGCAVISSNRGGLPEAVGSGAILVDPDDSGTIVAELRRLCRERDYLRTMREKAVAHAQASDWARAAAVITSC